MDGVCEEHPGNSSIYGGRTCCAREPRKPGNLANQVLPENLKNLANLGSPAAKGNLEILANIWKT